MNAYEAMSSNRAKIYSAEDYRLTLKPNDESTSIDHGYKLKLSIGEGIIPHTIMTMEMMLSIRAGAHKTLILNYPEIMIRGISAIQMNNIWKSIMALHNIKAFSAGRLICTDLWDKPNIDEMVEGILKAMIG